LGMEKKKAGKRSEKAVPAIKFAEGRRACRVDALKGGFKEKRTWERVLKGEHIPGGKRKGSVSGGGQRTRHLLYREGTGNFEKAVEKRYPERGNYSLSQCLGPTREKEGN